MGLYLVDDSWKEEPAIVTQKFIVYLGQVYSLKRKLWSDAMRLDSSNFIKNREKGARHMKTWLSLRLRLQNPWNEILKSNYPLSSEDTNVQKIINGFIPKGT